MVIATHSRRLMTHRHTARRVVPRAIAFAPMLLASPVLADGVFVAVASNFTAQIKAVALIG